MQVLVVLLALQRMVSRFNTAAQDYAIRQVQLKCQPVDVMSYESKYLQMCGLLPRETWDAELVVRSY